MEKLALKSLILAVAVVFAVSVAGCGEQNEVVTEKHRLIAAENIELQRQLEQRDREIKEQKELLEKSLEEKRVLEEEANKHLEEVLGSLLKDFGDNVKLQEESKKLKGEVEELQKENERLKGEIKQLKEEVEGLRRKIPDETKPQPL